MAFLDQVKGILPEISLQTVGNFMYMAIITVIIFLIVGGLFALWVIWYIQKKKFNKKIIIWGKVDGRPKIIGKDLVMERKIGEGGDTIFYWKKRKKITSRGEIQTGDNTYWYVEREDGEMINVGMEDFDWVFREAKINYLDKETRYARASLQKLNKDRFAKESFWQKYGKDVLNIIFVVIVSVMLLLIASKMVSLIGSVNAGIENYAHVTEKMAELLGKMDNLCSGSGVTPA